jgi:hypothetical protein
MARWATALGVALAVPLTVLVLTLPAGARRNAGDVFFIDRDLEAGKRFVLLPLVANSDANALARGRQDVVIFNHECEHCRRYLSGLSAETATEGEGGARRPWLIDTAVGAGPSDAAYARFPVAHVRSGIEVVASVPVRVTLEDGTLRSVSWLEGSARASPVAGK